ncbi:MAG: hypothetical protein ACTSRA_06095 [Promethearchaeota archaeon]
MVTWNLVYVDPRWNKKVIKLAENYNNLVKKGKSKKIEKIVDEISDGLIVETDIHTRRDFAFLIQQIEDRHPDDIFPDYIIEVAEYLLGGSTDDDTLVFKEPGTDEIPARGQGSSDKQEPFNIETIDLDEVDLINLEKITPEQLEKPTQKCAFGDGEILDENGEPYGNIWRCKSCKTVYHENCLRLCLLTKGSCQICDAKFLKDDDS